MPTVTTAKADRDSRLVNRDRFHRADGRFGTGRSGQGETDDATRGTVDGDADDKADHLEGRDLLRRQPVEKTGIGNPCHEVDIPFVDLDPFHGPQDLHAIFDDREFLVGGIDTPPLQVGLVGSIRLIAR